MKKSIFNLSLLILFSGINAQAQWTTSGSVVYATDSSKNVSVGTLINGANFYVQKNNAVTLGIKSQTAGATMFMDKGNVTANAAFAYKSLGVTLWNSGMLGGTNFSIRNVGLNTSPVLINNTNDYITLVGTGAGRVGVGTNAPTVKLDVVGDIKSSATIFANGGNSTNWNTAYGWGNHATAGYLTSFTEVDGSTTNELQTLSLSGNDLILSNGGGTVTLPASSLSWGLTGNAATNSGTHFIGTTDTASFIIKTNNQISGLLSGYNTNTSFGYQNLISNTNYNNTAIGYNALKLNTTGGYNTAMGANSLINNTVGYQNTAVGSNTLQINQDGNFNAAFGYGALLNNSNGNANVAIGNLALLNNTTGSSNIAIGNSALYNNTERSGNVAIGDSALFKNGIGAVTISFGIKNTAIGSNALNSNTIGSFNTGVGSEALYSSEVGDVNTAIGFRSLYLNTGSNNTATGAYSLYYNTTGNSNTASGMQALYSNTTGSYNTAFGLQTLSINTTGNENTAYGYKALASTTSDYNSSFGASALLNNQTGGANSANGWRAMYANTYGSHNAAYGTLALYGNTIGNSNTSIGYSSLYYNTSGGGNTAVGLFTLSNNTTGEDNTGIGTYADLSTSALSNGLTLGRNAIVNASNKVRIGNTTVTVIEGQVAYSYPSDARFKSNIKENVPGLDFINKLQPITYKFDTKKFDKHLMQNMPDSIQEQRMKGQDYTTSSNIIHSGFLAQDIEKICNELGYDFDGLHIADPKNPTDNYSVAYSQFVPSLVKAVQELNTENLELKRKQELAIVENAEIKKQLQQMQECLNVLCEKNDMDNKSSIENNLLQIQIAPNPTNGLVHISISGNEMMQNLTIKILNSAGKLIRAFNTSSNSSTFEFDTMSFSKGTYLVQVLNQQELLKTEKLIVQ